MEGRVTDDAPEAGAGGLAETLATGVPPDWADENGHMNEAFYLVAAARATDRFLDMLGAGPDYIRAGHSFFTVETHLRYLAEVHVGDRLRVTTQIIAGAGKKLHLFHRLWNGAALAATVETLLLHVDLTTRRGAPPRAALARRIQHLARGHAGLQAPGAGRFVGQAPAAAPRETWIAVDGYGFHYATAGG